MQLSGHHSAPHDGTSVGAIAPDGERDGGPPRVALVGRLCRWKGQHVFLEAAAQIGKAFPEARFQVVGSALFEEHDYERELHELVRTLKVEERVEFTGFRDDVSALIGAADIMVHASITGEPFGQVVIEGMAAGKPVVATDGGGVPEIVVDGVTGVLVPMRDAQSMAAAICRLLADPALARRMGQLGRQRVLEHFLIQHTADKVQQIYDELLE